MRIVLKGGPHDGHTDRVSEWTRLFNLDRSRCKGVLYKASGETDQGGRAVFAYAPRRSASDRARLRPSSPAA